MLIMHFTDHKRKQHHVSMWIPGVKIKAYLAMSHMVACFIVWQTAHSKFGGPWLADLELQKLLRCRTVVAFDLAMCISDSLITL